MLDILALMPYDDGIAGMKGTAEPNRGAKSRRYPDPISAGFTGRTSGARKGVIYLQYIVKDMRVIFPEGKVAERRPDLFAVVHGEFHDSKGQKLTISRKEITIEMAQSPDFLLDIAKGKLSFPSGKRGRKASTGATASEIEKRLAALKG